MFSLLMFGLGLVGGAGAVFLYALWLEENDDR